MYVYLLAYQLNKFLKNGKIRMLDDKMVIEKWKFYTPETTGKTENPE